MSGCCRQSPEQQHQHITDLKRPSWASLSFYLKSSRREGSASNLRIFFPCGWVFELFFKFLLYFTGWMMENIWYIQVWNWEMHLVCSFTQLQQRTSDRQLLAFRICQNRLIHQTAWKSLNMCQILAHWQFTTIQNSFLRRVSQSESCWVLSNRNSPVHKSGPPFCSCKSHQLKKGHFHLGRYRLRLGHGTRGAAAGQSSQWEHQNEASQEFWVLGYRGLILGWKIWISQSRSRSQGMPLMPGWDVQGSALVLDLSWAESGVQSCSCEIQTSV